MEQYRLINEAFGMTEWVQLREQCSPGCLFGMQMHIPQEGAPARQIGQLESDILHNGKPIDLLQSSISQTDETVKILYRSDCGVSCELNFSLDGKAGIISQTLSLENNSTHVLEVRRLQTRFRFAPGEFERYLQTGNWCYEGDGGWERLYPGGLHLCNEGGRTTQGNTPFLALRQIGAGRGIAFHILPVGDWEICVRSSSGGVGPQGDGTFSLSLGHATERVSIKVEAGERLDMPQVLIQSLPDGMLHYAAPRLHYFLNTHMLKQEKREFPVVYNTWMDCYDDLNQERLFERLKIAKELGCEVFCVDAGWFGQEGNWSECVGDWRERDTIALEGGLSGFSDAVRQSGLRFGLWIEPERVTTCTPIYQAHPEWFAQGSSGFYPILWMQEVYDYLKNEMLRVIDRYGVGWLKLDFNQELEVDPSGTGHMRYYQNLYRLIDELRQSRADVIFENCASGGLRSDINTMSHFDVSFSSDNANPWDGLSTFQQMSMRTSPNRIYRWLALQRGPDIPAYDRSKGTVEHTVVTPSSPGPGFAECETIDTEFACRLLAQSPMGLTGDIATLDLPTRDCIRTHILFYQQWRCFLANASLLTDAEPARLGNRKSWHVHQFVEEACERSLIFVYRMNHICETRWVKVSGLEPLNRYRVSLFGEENAEVRTGASLLESGVAIRLARRNSSAIVIIEQV